MPMPGLNAKAVFRRTGIGGGVDYTIPTDAATANTTVPVHISPSSLDSRVDKSGASFKWIARWPCSYKYSDGKVIRGDQSIKWTDSNGVDHTGTLRYVEKTEPPMPSMWAFIEEDV